MQSDGGRAFQTLEPEEEKIAATGLLPCDIWHIQEVGMTRLERPTRLER